MFRQFSSSLIFILFLLFTISLSNFSYADIVNKIEINGNDRISDETILVFS